MPDFRDFPVLAGANGLNRLVTSVTVMDAPDISDWLKGGEILLTTGYIMRDDISGFTGLIRNINNVHAAALFIKMKRFISSLPQEVYDIAESLNFPIISMPLNCAFTDVINPVLSRLVSEQERRLKISDNIHRSFTNLVLNGGDTEQIIKTLGEIIEGDTAYLDMKFGKDCISAESPQFQSDIDRRDVAMIMAKYKNYPIRIDKKIYGYIIYSDDKNITENFCDIAVEHAGTVVKLNIQRLVSNLEVESRHRTEFVLDLISGNIKSKEEIASKAALYGWNCEKGISVVVAGIDHYEQMKGRMIRQVDIAALESMKERLFEACSLKIKHVYRHTIFATINDTLVFIIEPPDGNAALFYSSVKTAADELRDIARNQFGFTMTAGVGEYHSSTLNIKQSYQEAKSAIKIGNKLYSIDQTMLYKELGIYRLLGPLSNTEETREFCNSSLGKLKKHDEKYGTDLLGTLICIKESDWNLKSAAAKMFIHYNTIKYRYKKIEEILNMNLEDSEERFIISISLKLMLMAQ